MVELHLVNAIRAQVRKCRAGGYKNASAVTKQLLRHWTSSERERKLFFCQIEAAETIIQSALTRRCIKMATGSGKTIVMAMLIAWSVLNKVQNRQAQWCSDAVLVMTPNLTVKERLGGASAVYIPLTPLKGGINLLNSTTLQEMQEPDRPLIPGAKGNYYDRFDLTPTSLKEYLGRGKIYITNWHQFAEIDDSKKRSIVQRGKESPTAFANRVLKNLGSAKNILVMNDEAHHAYRPAPPLPEADRGKYFPGEAGNSPPGRGRGGYANDPKAAQLTAEEKCEKEEATVWISGLDKINQARGLNFVADFTATPLYIQGSGYPEGSPFPWIVSDFGLVDAIECGIVKIPQVPVDSNSGRPKPEYFELWKWVNENLPVAIAL